MNRFCLVRLSLLGLSLVLSGSLNAATDPALGASTFDQLKDLPVVVPTNQGIPSIRAALPNHRTLLEVPNEPHILLLEANAGMLAASDHYRKLIEKSLDTKGTVVLQGEKDVMVQLKPRWVRVWPDASTVILTSRMGTRVEGIRDGEADDGRQVARMISTQVMRARAAEAMVRAGNQIDQAPNGRNAALPRDFTKTVEFSIRPTSPVETCTVFGNNLANSTFERPLTPDEQRALSREVSRWCQSGTLSSYFGTLPPLSIPHWTSADKPKLSILTEWALIRSEDVLSPSNSKHYFWVKSIGEGAGSGFTRAFQDTATFTNHIMYGLLDATIHAGWGRTYPRDPRTWTYPVGDEYWSSRDPELFGCDFGDSGSVCPSSASVVRLFPTDTFNNQVTIAQSTALSFGGTVGVTGSIENVQITASLNLNRTDTTTKTATVNLTNTQTSASKQYSRNTRWRPDVRAVWDYLIATGTTGPFGTATPTAATLNPEYDLLWQIPMQPNQGKLMRFSLFYEAGWNNCVRELCAGMRQPPDPTIPPQKRGYWTDAVLVDLQS